MEFLRFLSRNAPFLAAGILLTFASSFGQTYFISVFAGEIRGEFGLSHGAWGSIYAAGTMVSAIVMIWSGALTDTIRVRRLAIGVLAGLAVACLAMSLNQSAWLLPVVVFALRLFGQGMSSHIATVAMARWYVAMRGRALSIATLGYAFGEALLPLLFVALLTVSPWRMLWAAAAGVTICIIPLIVHLLRKERTPQSTREEQASVGMLGRHWKRQDVLRHWLFWAMVPSVLGPSAWGTALFFHQVHIAETKGWSHLEFVALFPIYTASAIATMLVSGWAIDRFGAAWLIPIAQVPAALGFLVLGWTGTLLGASVAVSLVALSFGTNATLPAAFWAEFYGTRHLGAIKALATSVMVLGSALGPGITGLLIDQGLPFPDQMLGIALWFLGVFALCQGALSRARALLPTP